ncbi:hypothetical protein [Dapis sp. BLCC M172]|uniref:hypothetical protein n=1 Tax=Dapis sp. BLCC M172 TaxID=2975281 RepID=UPI003CF5F0B8
MVDLSNESNWVLILDESRLLTDYSPNLQTSIPNFLVPVPFLSDFFRLFVTTNGKWTWVYAGLLCLQVGTIEENVPSRIATHKVYLDEWQILRFPEISLSPVCHLEFEVPYYFPDISVRIEQYLEEAPP